MSQSKTWNNIGEVGNIVLNKNHISSDGKTLRVFVETGSNSGYIFGSFSEVQGSAPRCAFYGTRKYGSDDGILITVFFDEDIPKSIKLHLTVAQDGATKYDDPIPYLGS